MPLPEMSYELASAAARDAGNRNMRENGRTEWNEDDWDTACAIFEQLMEPLR